MEKILNGNTFRTLINGEEIRHEVSTSFEPGDIKVTLYIQEGDDTYNKWLKRKGEKVNFKVTETDININVVLKNVVLQYGHDEIVMIILRFQ